MKKLKAILFLTVLPLMMMGQELPFDLTGAEAKSWIKENFYDGQHTELTYSEARKKMFGYIVNRNDSIECVYSGLKQAHAYGLEISFPDPFNTEHVVPQSLFNSNEPMRSDIHILQPSYDDWNNLRSNYGFKELDDNITSLWIYLDQSTGTIPSSNIDLYSEYIQFGWEPRESRKGDVARAVMYFFTMYPQYNINEVIDTSILCAWHEADTVNGYELLRDERTVLYQGNSNPYVLYPHWANQAFGCNVPEPPVVAFTDTFSLEIAENTTEVVCVDDYYDLTGFTGAGICDNGGLSVSNLQDLCISVTADSDNFQPDTICVYHCDGAVCDTTYIIVTSQEVVSAVLLPEHSIGVYPNPAGQSIHLTIDHWREYPIQATYVDTSGKEVQTEVVRGSKVYLPTPEASGTYFLYLRTRDGQLLGQTSVVVHKP